MDTVNEPAIMEGGEALPSGSDQTAMEKLMAASEIPTDEITLQSGEPVKPAEGVKTEETPKPEATEPKPPATPEPPKERARDDLGRFKKEIEDFDREVDGMQLRKGASPKSEEALKALKEKAKAQHLRAVGLEQAKAELEARAKELEGKAFTPEREKEYNELRTFRQAFDLENDPEFNEKHTTAIKNEETATMELLKSWGLPDTAQDYVAKNGGPFEFQVSEKLMPIAFKNEDGSRMTHSQWWSANIEAHLVPAQKRSLDFHIMKIQEKQAERDGAVKDARANREKLIKERAENQSKQSKEWGDRVMAHIPKVLAEIGEDTKLKDVPANATPEEKAAIDKHNDLFTRSQTVAKKYLSEINPENLTEAAAWAAYGQVVAKAEVETLRAEGTAKDAKIVELEGKLEKIKNAGKTKTKDSAPTVTTKTPQFLGGSSESAMERLMEAKYK